MDYCYSCRRTLNGALVCPGCGAYAPDIAPPASVYMGGAAPAAAAWDAFGAAPQGHPDPAAGPYPDMYVPGYAAPGEHAYAAPHTGQGMPGGGHPASGGHGYAGRDAVRIEPARPRGTAPRRLPAELDETDDDLPGSDTPSVLGPPSLAPTLHSGRAARRRQMARWKKNRRRAGVATAVALFGGGVTVASMQGHSGRNGATTASAADPQTPTALQTDNTSVSSPSDPATTSAAPTHTAPQSHGTAARPAPRTSQAAPDSITSIPTSVIPSGHPVTYSAASKPMPSTTTAPAAPAQTAASTGTTSTGSGSGTTATTPPSTPPASTPPATTAPSTPPPQQLCLLIVCLG